jgi:hypothetical protein
MDPFLAIQSRTKVKTRDEIMTIFREEAQKLYKHESFLRGKLLECDLLSQDLTI